MTEAQFMIELSPDKMIVARWSFEVKIWKLTLSIKLNEISRWHSVIKW